MRQSAHEPSDPLGRRLYDEAAAALWASGSKSLAATASKEAYDEFKQMVVAHRLMLKKGGAK